MNATISRRNLAMAAGVSAAAVAVACAPKVWAVEDNGSWDRETEILVCGFGGAGSVAAIQSHDNGCKVLVLEKQAADTEESVNHVPSIRISYSAIMNFHDKQSAVEYLTAACNGATPEDVIDSWADYSTENATYLYSLGASEEELVDTGASATEIPLELFPQGNNYNLFRFMNQGPAFWDCLEKAAKDRDIEVLYETPFKQLVVDDEGSVIGAVAEGPEGEMRVRASKAVILATGGFEYDENMLHQYIWGYPVRSAAAPVMTGDGIKAAQAVGADLWHMPLVGGRLISYFPELGYGIQNVTMGSYMFVDKYGRRFINEGRQSHCAVNDTLRFSSDLNDFPAIPCYHIMDQTAIDAGPVVSGSMLRVHPELWSSDNLAEIEKGWILKGDTIEELAEKIAEDPDAAGKMTPEVLAATLAAYNEYAEVGEDPEFGRAAGTMDPLATPPFYALKMYPGGLNTFGGPRRNAKGQIVRPDGSAIKGLYGAGEMGSILGLLYTGGGWNLSECIVSGRLAADNAALE